MSSFISEILDDSIRPYSIHISINIFLCVLFFSMKTKPNHTVQTEEFASTHFSAKDDP